MNYEKEYPWDKTTQQITNCLNSEIWENGIHTGAVVRIFTLLKFDGFFFINKAQFVKYV